MRNELNPSFFEMSPLSQGNPTEFGRTNQPPDTIKKSFLKGIAKRKKEGHIHFHNNAFGFGDLLPIEMLKLFIIEI